MSTELPKNYAICPNHACSVHGVDRDDLVKAKKAADECPACHTTLAAPQPEGGAADAPEAASGPA